MTDPNDAAIRELKEKAPNIPWETPDLEEDPDDVIPVLSFEEADEDEEEEDPRRGSSATYNGLIDTTWEYENDLREGEGHARYDDERYWADPQPDPWKGRIGLQSEAQQMEMNYADPALYQYKALLDLS